MNDRRGAEARINREGQDFEPTKKPNLEVIKGGAVDAEDVSEHAVALDIDHEAIQQRAQRGLSDQSYQSLEGEQLEQKLASMKQDITTEIEQQRAALQLGEQVLNSQSRETPPPLPGQKSATDNEPKPLSEAQLLDIQKQVLFHKARIEALTQKLSEIEEYEAPVTLQGEEDMPEVTEEMTKTYEPLFTEADEREAIEAQQKAIQDKRRETEAKAAANQQGRIDQLTRDFAHTESIYGDVNSDNAVWKDLDRAQGNLRQKGPREIKEPPTSTEQKRAELDHTIELTLAQINADFGIDLKPNGQPKFGIRNMWRFNKMTKNPDDEFAELYTTLTEAYQERTSLKE